ncbi:MAG: hypothetical protein JRM95_05095, partial [Nitrososphaerota archaeon]|nr:hypothetical protein [Nitrososphaerota archaeon]
MQGDDIHDYEYEVKNALARLGTDPRLREADRKLILAFHKHIKAQDVSLGRQAKYLNQLHTASTLMRVPWRRAKRADIEDLMTQLADHEIVTEKNVVDEKTGEKMKAEAVRHYA